MMRWLLKPGPFAVGAVLFWLAWLAAPGFRAGQLSRSAPLAQWDLTTPTTPWRTDFAHGWALLPSVAISVAESPGVSVDFEPRFGGTAVVAVMWRQLGDVEWRWQRFAHPLGRSWDYIDLSQAPHWQGQIYDLAVASDGMLPLAIRAVTVESRGPLAEWSRAWRGFRVVELFDEFSINFLYGTQIKQTNWTLPVLLTLAAFAMLHVVAAALQRRALAWRNLITLAFAAWILLDLRFTADVAANARADAARFPAVAAPDAVVADGDRAYADLVAAVRQLVPPNSRMAFFAADQGLLNKAQYVFFPRFVTNWGERVGLARYIVFFHQPIQFDPTRGALTVGNKQLAVRVLTQLGDDVAVFEVQWRRLRD